LKLVGLFEFQVILEATGSHHGPIRTHPEYGCGMAAWGGGRGLDVLGYHHKWLGTFFGFNTCLSVVRALCFAAYGILKKICNSE